MGGFVASNLTAQQLENAVVPYGSYPLNRSQRWAINLGRRLPNNYAGRRAAGWIRYLVQATARTPVDMEVLGMRMRLRLGDNACERRLLVTPQYFEPVSLYELRQRVEPGFHFVDVGANVGTYSLLAASRGQECAKILAIEANPGLTKRLRENAILNGFKIAIEQVAASDRDGRATLRLDENNLGASTLLSHVNVRGRSRQIEVHAAKLFDLVCKHGFARIDAMKLDIEGHEDSVLMAFINEAPEELWPKLLIIEHNKNIWKCDLEAELLKRGWRQIRSNENLLLVRP